MKYNHNLTSPLNAPVQHVAPSDNVSNPRKMQSALLPLSNIGNSASSTGNVGKLRTDILPAGDFYDLSYAVRLLEKRGYFIGIAMELGKPITMLVERLPQIPQLLIQQASRKAILRSLDLALSTMDETSRFANPNNRKHKSLAVLSGAAGGFIGLPALLPELVISSAIMLRSIATIAIAEGEEIDRLDARLECVKVFALGNSITSRGTASNGYYSTRASLSRSINAAKLESTLTALLSRANSIQAGAATRLAEESVPRVVGKIAQREFVATLSHSLTRFVEQVTLRFSPVVAEKIAAQTLPFAGAGAGALINFVFINHYQNLARGHFIIRRLERKHGREIVMQAYDQAKLFIP